MISENLLTIVMLIEIGLLALAVGLFFLHGLWLFFDDKSGRKEWGAMERKGFRPVTAT